MIEKLSRFTTSRTLDDLEFPKLKDIVKQYAASELGEKAIQNINPCADQHKIQSELELIEECYLLLRKKDPLRLGEMTEFGPYISQAKEHPPLQPEDFLTISRTLESAGTAKTYILEKEEDLPRLHRIVGEIDSFSKFNREIRDKIDRRGKIREDASKDLLDLTNKKKKFERQVKEKLDAFLDRFPSLIQDRVIARRSNRLVVPIKSSARNQVNCVIHESSNSGQTLFAEPSSAVELNNEIRDLSSEIRDEKRRILKELTEKIEEKERPLMRTQKALQKLDSAYGRANFSLDYDCSVPKISQNGPIHLIEARHPLLDQQEVVPVTIHFGDNGRGAIITGPNTGGKTVTLKTIGLFSLMIQSGIPIPASIDSRIPVFSGIYSDIGDEQSIEQSLSTFSSHMGNIVNIIQLADSQSLILLDELGAGTDPREGAALGLGLLEHFLETHCLFAVTTHYTALKNFSFKHPDLATFSVDFDPDELVPTYHILEGVPGRSNAFIIASRLGLPDDVISKAEGFLAEEEIKAEDIIKDLTMEKRKLRDQNQDLEHQLDKVQQLQQEYEQKVEEIKQDKTKALEDNLKQIEQFVSQAKKRIEEAIASAKEEDLEKKRDKLREIQNIENRAENLANNLRKSQRKKQFDVEDLEQGKTVWVKSADNSGTILRIHNKDKIEVKVKGIKLETDITDLKPSKESKKSFSQPKTKFRSSHPTNVEMELNVRGRTVREALREVDKYLDRLLRSDRQKGRILHGKGTGKLRREIRNHLRNQPWVDKCYGPPPSQGGEGITVVELQ